MDQNSKKKILILGHVDGHGGSQTAFKRLVDFVISEGHKVKIVVLTSEDSEWLFGMQNVILDSVIYKTPDAFTKIKKIIKLFRTVLRARRFNPDIFISVGLNNTANLISRFLKKESFTLVQDFNADRRLDDKLWHKSRKLNDGLALQAPSMVDFWRKGNANLNKVDWLPCFPSIPVEGVLHEMSADHSAFKIVYFGRLADNKGLDILLMALAEKEISENVTLDIWGNGEEKEYLIDLVKKLKLSNRVAFKGNYPEGIESAKIMASYDLLALCSTRTEGLPLILLEAMAYGIPILATDVGAIRDCCIGNPNSVLIAADTISIAKGINKAYRMTVNKDFNPHEQQRFYKEHFSFEVMAGRWRACLNDPKRFFPRVNS